MPGIHRNGDLRVCTAFTIVVGQGTVYANNRLVAVNGDPNTHQNGGLIAANNNVFINNKLVVNHTPDNALPDRLCGVLPPNQRQPHCNPRTANASTDVFVGD